MKQVGASEFSLLFRCAAFESSERTHLFFHHGLIAGSELSQRLPVAKPNKQTRIIKNRELGQKHSFEKVCLLPQSAAKDSNPAVWPERGTSGKAQTHQLSPATRW